jgi:hypothetical protein
MVASQNTSNKKSSEQLLALRMEQLILKILINPHAVPALASERWVDHRDGDGAHVTRIALLKMIHSEIEPISSALLNKIITDMKHVGTIGISHHFPTSVYLTKSARAALSGSGLSHGGSL